jgi:16S rRNA (adenine1518-N6/adenine1519-N6)-dimethyltransferase
MVTPHPSIHSLLKKYGIRPKKRLGQHFLTAVPTIYKIVWALDISSDDDVIEIGSGLGFMTNLLAHRARRVLAVERDQNLIEIARREFNFDNIAWIHSDILKLTPRDLLGQKGVEGKLRRAKVAGNIPYNISTPILFWMLDNRQALSRAVIMVQKEVGMRIVAPPGGKDYGIPSILIQAFADCKRLFDLSPKSFTPPPAVTSTVVQIDFRKENPKIGNEARFRAVVKAAFGRRRKTLRNALLGARGLWPDAHSLDSVLAACGIDAHRRPATLSVDDYICLAADLEKS